MKTAIAIILAAGVVLGVGGYYVLQQKNPAPSQDPKSVVHLQTELAKKDQELKQLRVEHEKAREQARQVAMRSDEIAAQAHARELALSNSLAGSVEKISASGTSTPKAEESGGSGNGASMGKFLSNMLKDPDMRAMVREQQRTMMKQLYGPLERQLNLTPEESTRLGDIMSGTMDKSTELAMGMFSGTAEERAEATKKLTAEQQASETQIKDLLGEDRFAAYKDYQQTVGERAQLASFRQSQQMSGAAGISDEQTEALLALMREEKQKVASTSGVAFPSQDPGQSQNMFRPGQLEKLLQAQQTVNENVYNRANEVLTPEQLQAFGKFQATQMQMMSAGLKMAGKLMGAEDNSAPAPAN